MKMEIDKLAFPPETHPLLQDDKESLVTMVRNLTKENVKLKIELQKKDKLIKNFIDKTIQDE